MAVKTEETSVGDGLDSAQYQMMLELADEMRVQHLNKAQALHLLRQKSWQQELQRLTQKLGPDAPRVQKLQARLAVIRKLDQRLNHEIKVSDKMKKQAEK